MRESKASMFSSLERASCRLGRAARVSLHDRGPLVGALPLRRRPKHEQARQLHRARRRPAASARLSSTNNKSGARKRTRKGHATIAREDRGREREREREREIGSPVLSRVRFPWLCIFEWGVRTFAPPPVFFSVSREEEKSWGARSFSFSLANRERERER